LHDVDYFLLAYWHNFRFRQGDVIGLDRKQHQLRLGVVRDEDGAEILPERVLRYDTLIFCVGSVNNDFGIPGVDRRAISLDAPADAERFHRRLLPRASARTSAARAESPQAVDVVIIGAGATGVELAAEVRHCTRAHASYGLEFLKPERDVHLTLIEAAPRILPPLPTTSRKRPPISCASSTSPCAPASASPRSKRMACTPGSGAVLKADLVAWAAGIKAPAWLDTSTVSKSTAAISSSSTRRSRRLAIPTSFALGDCAACPWPQAGPTAICRRARRSRGSRRRSSSKASRRGLAGNPLPRFKFTDFGSLVSLGELSAWATSWDG
jgi:NADH dehydrogenase